MLKTYWFITATMPRQILTAKIVDDRHNFIFFHIFNIFITIQIHLKNSIRPLILVTRDIVDSKISQSIRDLEKLKSSVYLIYRKLSGKRNKTRISSQSKGINSYCLETGQRKPLQDSTPLVSSLKNNYALFRRLFVTG